MFQKIKSILSIKDDEVVTTQPTIVPPASSENKTVVNFEQYIHPFINNIDFPIGAKSSLNEIMRLIKDINFQDLNFEKQSDIRRILEKDILDICTNYLSVPKAHAVSFILQNGKTLKATLIEQLGQYQHQINVIWNEAVTEKTNMILKGQKTNKDAQSKKRDFFDM